MNEISVGSAALAGSGWVALIGKMLWERFFTAEGKANDTLITSLNERIAAQEVRLNNLEGQLDTERNARRAAEDKIHKLEMVNMALLLELKKHDIAIPEFN